MIIQSVTIRWQSLYHLKIKGIYFRHFRHSKLYELISYFRHSKLYELITDQESIVVEDSPEGAK
jgi:hypothetical protein